MADMNIKSFDVQIVSNEQQLKDAYYIRKKVFVEEQHVAPELEIDDLEQEAIHFVLYIDQVPSGAGRLRLLEGYGKVERICVLKKQRVSGAGTAIMSKIEEYAHNEGIHKLKLNAQTHAIGFYSHLGYEITSDEFYEAGIPHKSMAKSL
jgi:predicted GNAT family N-acyltransferase